MDNPIMAIRKEIGLTMPELAIRSGTPKTSLWHIEKGTKRDINRTLLVYFFDNGYDVGQVVKDYDNYLKEIKIA